MSTKKIIPGVGWCTTPEPILLKLMPGALGLKQLKASLGVMVEWCPHDEETVNDEVDDDDDDEGEAITTLMEVDGATSVIDDHADDDGDEAYMPKGVLFHSILML
uniref:Uncharacterized protein n=1 Tax=Solanum tuberosum TaxID=4113 RepID=M1D8R5_SOLTU